MTTTQALFSFRSVALIDRLKPSNVKTVSFAPMKGKELFRFTSQGLIMKAATTCKEADLGIQAADDREMLVKGSIDGIEVFILIDSGSSENFIPYDIAEFLNLSGMPLDNDYTLLPNVVDIKNCACFRDVEITIGDFKSCVDLVALSYDASKEIILGRPWLSKLGKITSDYSSMVMEFCVDGKQFRITSCAGMALNGVGALQPPAGLTAALWDKLRVSTDTDEFLGEIKQKLITNPNSINGYTLQDGCVLHGGRIMVPNDNEMRKRLFYEFHKMLDGRHSGSLQTLHGLRQSSKWEGMKYDVRRYVQYCFICQRNNSNSRVRGGLLEPLPILSKGWRDIRTDFIYDLPKSGGFDTIFVVVDCFTKYAHFIALASPFSTKKVAEAFNNRIVRLHGLPESTTYDCDQTYMRLFWKDLKKLPTTYVWKSLANHHQTEDHNEVVDHTLEKYFLEKYLRCFVGSIPTTWESFLAWAEYLYNTTYYNSIRMTPFEAVYDRPPPHLRTYLGDAVISEIDETLCSHCEISGLLKLKLSKAINQIQRYKDRNRRPVEFKVGDWVYLKLQPYMQQPVFRQAFLNMARRIFGPFQVLERLGTFAYRIDLPTDSGIHPVFHVSMLKKRLSDGVVATVSLPPYCRNGLPKLVPLVVLDYRWVQSQGDAVREALIHWSSLSENDATWEPVELLRAEFPELNVLDEL